MHRNISCSEQEVQWSFEGKAKPTRIHRLRHTVVCRVAKKVERNTRLLFTRTKISPISTSRILTTTEQISTKFTNFMLCIYLTLHTEFDVDCASGSRDICS